MSQSLESTTKPRATFGGDNPFPDDFPRRDWSWDCIQEETQSLIDARKKHIETPFRSGLEGVGEHLMTNSDEGHWTDDFDDRLNAGYEPWNDPNDEPENSCYADVPEDVKFFQQLNPEQQSLWRTVVAELRTKDSKTTKTLTHPIIYKMICEGTQRDERLGEKPLIVDWDQSDPPIQMNSHRKWRILSTETYHSEASALSFNWVMLADEQTPVRGEWLTTMMLEFFGKGSLSIAIDPDGRVIQQCGPSENPHDRIGERILETDEDEITTPTEWVIDRCDWFVPNDAENSYTQIALYWCKSQEL